MKEEVCLMRKHLECNIMTVFCNVYFDIFHLSENTQENTTGTKEQNPAK